VVDVAEPRSSGRVVIAIVILTTIAAAGFTYTFLVPNPARDNDGRTTFPGMPYREDYTQHSPIVIDGDASLVELAASEGWPGDGSTLDPYVIEGLEVHSADNCISINSVQHEHLVIRGCLLWTTSKEFGICLRISNSSNVEVESCVVHTGLEGISAFQSSNLWIQDCGVYDAGFGINASACNNAWIMNCIVLNCTFGVTFVGGFQVNVFNSRVFSSTVGIMSQFSSYTVVQNCTVAFNERGIDADEDCLNWYILECAVLNNTEVGIEVGPQSNNVTVTVNRIGWNGLNARDDGLTNYWDQGSGNGNAWSDYSGTGVYVIQGTAGSVDNFPTLLSH
jgi:hypothetical protein